VLVLICVASGPRKIKLFVNEPSLGFDRAEAEPAVQDLVLEKEELDGRQIPLKLVRFQNVSSLQIFVESNQEESDVTFINKLSVFGTTVAGMNVGEIKKPEE